MQSRGQLKIHPAGNAGRVDRKGHSLYKLAMSLLKTLSPGEVTPELRSQILAIDIREPYERIGAQEAILQMPNVPMNDWGTIPEQFPQRPLLLCCAAGVRTRMCVGLLQHPEGIYAWTGSIHDWVRESQK